MYLNAQFVFEKKIIGPIIAAKGRNLKSNAVTTVQEMFSFDKTDQ